MTSTSVPLASPVLAGFQQPQQMMNLDQQHFVLLKQNPLRLQHLLLKR